MTKVAPWFSLTIGIFRGYFPTIIFLEKIHFFPGEDDWERFVLFMCNIAQIYLYYYVCRFIVQAMIDFNRKGNIMEDLDHMVCPLKIYPDKIIPTLDYLMPCNAYSWFKMRKIVKNYGLNMTSRHELLVPALLLYLVLVFLFNWVVELQFIDLGNSIVPLLVPFLRIDYILFAILILLLMLVISNINSFYEVHITSLQHIRDFLDQISFFKPHYLKKGKIEVDLHKVEKNIIYDKEPTDPVIKALIKRIKDLYPPEQYSAVVSNSYKAWNLNTTNLEKEKANDKIAILTFKIEGSIILRFYTLVLFSLLATIKYWLNDDDK
jgi:hypothetical protein